MRLRGGTAQELGTDPGAGRPAREGPPPQTHSAAAARASAGPAALGAYTERE